MLGCSKDQSASKTQPQLRLTGEITRAKLPTRVNAAGFETNDQVGVYISNNGTITDAGNFVDNLAFTYNNGYIDAPEGNEIYWESSDASLDIYAYYPYDPDITSVTEYPFSVEWDQDTEDGFYNSDVIFASATGVTPQGNPVNLKFKHALTKIAIKLVAGNGISEEEFISKEKKVFLRDIITDGTINLLTGEATPGNGTHQVNALEEVGTLNYSAIVYPHTNEFDNALIINLVMDGKRYEYRTNVSYDAGTEYTYTLETDVENNKLNLASTDVEEWTEGDEFQAKFEEIITDLDPTFKAYLLNEEIYTYDAESGGYDYVPGNMIDANDDGNISVAEAKNVVYIDISGQGVESLNGIHNFPNLLALIAPREMDDEETPALTSVDLSENTKLMDLNLRYHNLDELNLENNRALRSLDCTYNKLTSIDLSRANNLLDVNLSANELSSIDVTKCPYLSALYVDNNFISTINLSNNRNLQYLDVGNNMLTELDLSNNVSLSSLACWGNEITSLDLSNNAELLYINAERNQLEDIDISNCANIMSIHLGDNNLSSIDVSNIVSLGYLDVGRNGEITELDVTNNPLLGEVRFDETKVSVLDFSKSNYDKVIVVCGYTDDSDNIVNPKIILRTDQTIDEDNSIYEGELEIEYVD